MKSHPVGVELFHAVKRTDRQSYMTKAIVAFRNFVNAPKKTKMLFYAILPVFLKIVTFWKVPSLPSLLQFLQRSKHTSS
jgi:hypothetical protein